MIGLMKTFRELLQEHIDLRYEGNSAAFSRATGFTPQTVSAWRQGKVTVPQLATRRALAKELGISPLELLISMDVIDQSEVDAPVNNESPAIRELRAIIDGKDFTEEDVRHMSEMLRLTVSVLEGKK